MITTFPIVTKIVPAGEPLAKVDIRRKDYRVKCVYQQVVVKRALQDRHLTSS